LSLAWFVRRHAIDVRPLRHAAYRRLFVGNAVSFVGYQFTAVAVPVQMYAMTGSSFLVGLLGVAALVPLLIFALWGGAVADVRDRRSVLLVSSSVMWAATIGLLLQAVFDLRSPGLLLALVAVQSAGFAISSPTRQAMLPRLVPEDLIASASTLGYTVSTLASVVGPLGAGLVLAHSDYAIAYAVDAVLFSAAMWGIAGLPVMPPADRSHLAHDSRWRDLVDGLRYVRTQPLLMLTFAIDIAAMVLAMPRALFPEVAQHRYGGGAAAGWLFSAIAIGSLAAGLFSGWISRIHRQGLAIVLAVVAWGVAVAIAGLAPALWLAVLGLAAAGAADMISAVYRQTILLTHAPDEMRGRLQGAFIAVVAGGPRLGDLRAGSMAAATGATVAWVSGGVAAAVVAVLLAVAYPALLRYASERTER
jgi:MFS family permease